MHCRLGYQLFLWSFQRHFWLWRVSATLSFSYNWEQLGQQTGSSQYQCGVERAGEGGRGGIYDWEYYSYYNCWMGLYILIFQIFIIVLYGIFVRTGSTLSGSSNIQTPLYFTLAFTLLNMRFRMYEWNQLANYLFIMALTFQMNTLYIMFWDAAFNTGFSATTTINSYYLIINIECVLAILVTVFQFTGKLTLEQIFALSMVEIFAFALNFSICQFGLRSITGGGTITIFLFGYVFAAPIKKLVCDEDIENQSQERQRYFTLTMKIIGLVLCIILWFNFSATTVAVDVNYLVNTYYSVYNSDALVADAFIHMFLGFSSAIGTTVGLRILGEKIILQKFIHTLLLVNSIISQTGMFLSSSAVVIIDPFASLLMGVTCPVLIFIMEKYLDFILIKGYSIDAIIICALGGIFDAIFAAGRNSRSPSLSDNAYKQGGLQFASILVTAGFSALFSLLACVILRCFNPRQSINKDNMIWFIDQETLPIYKDDPIFKKIMGESNDSVLKQQNLLFNLKNSYITERERQNVEQGKILKQQLEADSRIK